jgi:hypothetical protein
VTSTHYKGIMLAILLLGTAFAPPVSADIPSHVIPSTSRDKGFDFPSQLSLFSSLGATSHAILVNVTQSQFTNASANAANYSKLADNFSALGITRENEKQIVGAIQSSHNDLITLVGDAQHYDELNRREQALISADPNGNESQNNVLNMQALAADIRHLSDDLIAQNGAISAFAAQNGLNTSFYTTTTNAANAYATQINNDLHNLTKSAFQNTTTTFDLSPANANYGGALHITGAVRANQTGLPNGSVRIVIDGNAVAHSNTNASGYYEDTFSVSELAPGTHTVTTNFLPTDATPINPSSSTARNFTIGTSAVSNNLRVSGTSLLQDSVTLSGALLTEMGVPVRNTTVLLYVDNTTYKGAQTDENGFYSLTYSQSVPSALTSLTPRQLHVYTLFTPDGQPLNAAQSDVVSVALGGFGSYMIGGVLIAGALATFFVYNVWTRRTAAELAPEIARPFGEEPIAAEEKGAEPIAVQPFGIVAIEEIDAGVERAHELCQEGQGALAVRSLYGATVRALSLANGVTITQTMTTREIFSRLVSAAPALRAPLRALTCLHELASYSDLPVAAPHVTSAIEAAVSIEGLIDAGSGETR